MLTDLHIYDFDGTLFRSPEKPSGWKGSNWWGHQDSLGRPYVPDDPDSSWWVSSTLASAHQSIAAPNVLAVLITGRAMTTFARWRVAELLRSQNLDFDFVLLAPNTGNTAAFKKEAVDRLLRRFSTIQKVEVWEDNRKNAESMQAAAAGRAFNLTLVRSTPKEVVYVPEEPDPVKVAARWAGLSPG